MRNTYNGKTGFLYFMLGAAVVLGSIVTYAYATDSEILPWQDEPEFSIKAGDESLSIDIDEDGASISNTSEN